MQRFPFLKRSADVDKQMNTKNKKPFCEIKYM